jgi:hypothetical protein
LLRAGSRWLKRKANEKKYTPIAEGLVCREIPSDCGEECQNCKFKTSGAPSGRPVVLPINAASVNPVQQVD